MHLIEELATRLRTQVTAGQHEDALRTLGQMTDLVRNEPALEVPVMNDFYGCMRLVAHWFPQIWPAALEISRAVHTARPDPDTAAWLIEALRMNGQDEAAHDIAYESVHRFNVTPALLVQTAAAYLGLGHEDAARRFLAAGKENGCDLAPTIAAEPNLRSLARLLDEG